MRVTRWTAATAAMFALALGGCGAPEGEDSRGQSTEAAPGDTPATDADGDSTGEPVTLGCPLILSGPISPYGIDNRAGIEIALDHLNEDGGVLGGTVTCEFEDTAFEAEQAITLMRSMAQSDIPVSIGPVSTVEAVAVAPIAEQLQLPFISTGSAGPWEGDFNPYVFRVNITTVDVLPDVLARLQELRDIETAAILYDQSQDYTVSERDTAQSALTDLGVEVLGTEAFSAGDRNYGPQLSNITQGGVPDLIYLGATTEEAALIIAQARERGIDSLFLGGAGLNDPSILEISDGAAAGAITFFPFNPTSDREIVQRFVSEYEARHDGATPPAYAALGYDATMLAADAIERAGSTDREAVRDALASTDGLELVNGSYTYEGSGDNVAAEVNLFELAEDGSFQLLE